MRFPIQLVSLENIRRSFTISPAISVYFFRLFYTVVRERMWWSLDFLLHMFTAWIIKKTRLDISASVLVQATENHSAWHERNWSVKRNSVHREKRSGVCHRVMKLMNQDHTNDAREHNFYGTCNEMACSNRVILFMTENMKKIMALQ